MLEMVVFAVTFVVAQALTGLIVMRLFMSKWFIKKYVKMAYKTSMELTTELLEEEN